MARHLEEMPAAARTKSKFGLRLRNRNVVGRTSVIILDVSSARVQQDHTAQHLIQTLCATNGLNEFFEKALLEIAILVVCRRVVNSVAKCCGCVLVVRSTRLVELGDVRGDFWVVVFERHFDQREPSSNVIAPDKR